MNGYWKVLLLKIAGWAIVEIVLNLAGLDNIADYGEFLLKPQLFPGVWGASISVVLLSTPRRSLQQSQMVLK